jgi:hypothetical protein
MPPRPAARAVALLAVALVAPLALVACGDDTSASQATTPTTTAAPASSGAASAAAMSSTTAPGAASATTATATAPTTAAPTTTAAGPVIEITYRGGKLEGNGRKQVAKGQTVTLRVTSDVADEVHVHGYDKDAVIPAGGTAEVVFRADVAGVFEVELHKKHLKIADLEVR